MDLTRWWIEANRPLRYLLPSSIVNDPNYKEGLEPLRILALPSQMMIQGYGRAFYILSQIPSYLASIKTDSIKSFTPNISINPDPEQQAKSNSAISFIGAICFGLSGHPVGATLYAVIGAINLLNVTSIHELKETKKSLYESLTIARIALNDRKELTKTVNDLKEKITTSDQKIEQLNGQIAKLSSYLSCFEGIEEAVTQATMQGEDQSQALAEILKRLKEMQAAQEIMASHIQTENQQELCSQVQELVKLCKTITPEHIDAIMETRNNTRELLKLHQKNNESKS